MALAQTRSRLLRMNSGRAPFALPASVPASKILRGVPAASSGLRPGIGRLFLLPNGTTLRRRLLSTRGRHPPLLTPWLPWRLILSHPLAGAWTYGHSLTKLSALRYRVQATRCMGRHPGGRPHTGTTRFPPCPAWRAFASASRATIPSARLSSTSASHRAFRVPQAICGAPR